MRVGATRATFANAVRLQSYPLRLPRGNGWNAIPTCGTVKTFAGVLTGDISTKVEPEGGTATITMSGPADAWFAVGLNAQVMSDSPYVARCSLRLAGPSFARLHLSVVGSSLRLARPSFAGG
jgi:hypothetical protein